MVFGKLWSAVKGVFGYDGGAVSVSAGDCDGYASLIRGFSPEGLGEAERQLDGAINALKASADEYKFFSRATGRGLSVWRREFQIGDASVEAIGFNRPELETMVSIDYPGGEMGARDICYGVSISRLSEIVRDGDFFVEHDGRDVYLKAEDFVQLVRDGSLSGEFFTDEVLGDLKEDVLVSLARMSAATTEKGFYKLMGELDEHEDCRAALDVARGLFDSHNYGELYRASSDLEKKVLLEDAAEREAALASSRSWTSIILDAIRVPSWAGFGEATRTALPFLIAGMYASGAAYVALDLIDDGARNGSVFGTAAAGDVGQGGSRSDSYSVTKILNSSVDDVRLLDDGFVYMAGTQYKFYNFSAGESTVLPGVANFNFDADGDFLVFKSGSDVAVVNIPAKTMKTILENLDVDYVSIDDGDIVTHHIDEDVDSVISVYDTDGNGGRIFKGHLSYPGRPFISSKYVAYDSFPVSVFKRAIASASIPNEDTVDAKGLTDDYLLATMYSQSGMFKRLAAVSLPDGTVKALVGSSTGAIADDDFYYVSGDDLVVEDLASGEEITVEDAFSDVDCVDAHSDRAICGGSKGVWLVKPGPVSPSENSPPVFDNLPGSLETKVGRTFWLEVDASDADGDELTFSDNTELFDIDPITGEIEWTPDENDVGEHRIKITVDDGNGGVAEKYVDLDVLPARPTLEKILFTADPHLSPETLEHVSEFYNKLTLLENPDLVVILGDLADKSEYLNLVNEVFDKQNGTYYLNGIPVLMIPGNHDAYHGEFRVSVTVNGKTYSVSAIRPYTSDGFFEYERQVGYTNQHSLDFVEEYKTPNGVNIKLIGINSGEDEPETDPAMMLYEYINVPNSKGMGPDQLLLLEKEGESDGIKIALMHHTPLHKDAMGLYVGGPRDLRQELVDLCLEKKINVISGHVHGDAQRHCEKAPDGAEVLFDEVPDVVHSCAYMRFYCEKEVFSGWSYVGDRTRVEGAGPIKFEVEVNPGTRAGGHLRQTDGGETDVTAENGVFLLEGTSLQSLTTEVSFQGRDIAHNIKSLALEDGKMFLRVLDGDYGAQRESGKIYLETPDGLQVEKGSIFLFKMDWMQRSVDIDFDGDGVFDETVDLGDGDFTQQELAAARDDWESGGRDGGASGSSTGMYIAVTAGGLVFLIAGGVAYALRRSKKKKSDGRTKQASGVAPVSQVPPGYPSQTLSPVVYPAAQTYPQYGSPQQVPVAPAQDFAYGQPARALPQQGFNQQAVPQQAIPQQGFQQQGFQQQAIPQQIPPQQNIAPKQAYPSYGRRETVQVAGEAEWEDDAW